MEETGKTVSRIIANFAVDAGETEMWPHHSSIISKCNIASRPANNGNFGKFNRIFKTIIFIPYGSKNAEPHSD